MSPHDLHDVACLQGWNGKRGFVTTYTDVGKLSIIVSQIEVMFVCYKHQSLSFFHDESIIPIYSLHFVPAWRTITTLIFKPPLLSIGVVGGCSRCWCRLQVG